MADHSGFYKGDKKKSKKDKKNGQATSDRPVFVLPGLLRDKSKE